MELRLRTPLISIYWLPDIRTGYGVWTGLPRPDPTREALAGAEALLVEKQSHRWISSTEDALVAPPETQEHIVAWLRRMGQTGQLRAWADIPPRSATARLVVKNLGAESVLHSIRFAQFPSLEQAKSWIAEK